MTVLTLMSSFGACCRGLWRPSKATEAEEMEGQAGGDDEPRTDPQPRAIRACGRSRGAQGKD